MNVAELESEVLALPVQERRQFVHWLDEHREELLPDEADIHPAVQAEILRRRDEVLAHPELLQPVTEEWFDSLKRKLADARPPQAPPR
jgi:hypothetical protein